MRKTYCNPLPLPDYPAARPFSERCRATGDPSVLCHEGKWYMYPSHGACYVTDDFVNWECRRMRPESIYDVARNGHDITLSPSVAYFNGAFYLTAHGNSRKSPIYKADTPLGPWHELGSVTDPDGNVVRPFLDPGLFADDDGRLYVYWGGSERGGILAAECDSRNPARLLTGPVQLFAFNPEHEWERWGAFNEDRTKGWIEVQGG